MQKEQANLALLGLSVLGTLFELWDARITAEVGISDISIFLDISACVNDDWTDSHITFHRSSYSQSVRSSILLHMQFWSRV